MDDGISEVAPPSAEKLEEFAFGNWRSAQESLRLSEITEDQATAILGNANLLTAAAGIIAAIDRLTAAVEQTNKELMFISTGQKAAPR